jgi:hypothetical protein
MAMCLVSTPAMDWFPSPRPPGAGGRQTPAWIARAPAAALLVALSATGCALTTMTLATPTRATTAPSQLGGGREVLLVMPFVDQRDVQNRCGMKKNGYNMETADILCAEPPQRWLATLLGDELRAAGFRVVVDAAQASSSALRLEGTLKRFFLEPDLGLLTFSPEADLELQLVATDPSGLYALRNFYFKGRETALSGLEENFRAAADAAVRQMLGAVVGAVAELTRTYPQLGLPPRVALGRVREGRVPR